MMDIKLGVHGMIQGWLVLSILLRLGHHHLAELVKVHGAGAVFVELLQDALQLLISQGGQQLSYQTSKSLGGDVAQALLVINPEQE